MVSLEILKYPHPVLKRRSQEVEQVDQEVKELIEDMTATMYEANGVGLAACQVGVNKRVVVLDVSPIDPEHGFLAIINPEIVSGEGEMDYEEGCLSVPEFHEHVKRKEKVKVRGLSQDGKQIEFDASGILAIAIQHEIDHLNGLLVLDRVSSLKREMYRNQLRKRKKAG